MGSITITVPQNIQVNYTVENMSLIRSLLSLFLDKSDLIDQVAELAMRSRETKDQGEKGTPGIDLLKFAGTLRAEDAEGMMRAIEDDCSDRFAR